MRLQSQLKSDCIQLQFQNIKNGYHHTIHSTEACFAGREQLLMRQFLSEIIRRKKCSYKCEGWMFASSTAPLPTFLQKAVCCLAALSHPGSSRCTDVIGSACCGSTLGAFLPLNTAARMSLDSTWQLDYVRFLFLFQAVTSLCFQPKFLVSRGS